MAALTSDNSRTCFVIMTATLSHHPSRMAQTCMATIRLPVCALKLCGGFGLSIVPLHPSAKLRLNEDSRTPSPTPVRLALAAAHDAVVREH